MAVCDNRACDGSQSRQPLLRQAGSERQPAALDLLLLLHGLGTAPGCTVPRDHAVPRRVGPCHAMSHYMAPRHMGPHHAMWPLLKAQGTLLLLGFIVPGAIRHVR